MVRDLKHQSDYACLVHTVLDLDPAEPTTDITGLYKDLLEMSDRLVEDYEENEFEEVQALEGLGFRLMVSRFIDFLTTAKFDKPGDAGNASGTIVAIHRNILHKWQPFFPSWTAKLQYREAKRNGYLK